LRRTDQCLGDDAPIHRGTMLVGLALLVAGCGAAPRERATLSAAPERGPADAPLRIDAHGLRAGS
jgi:hypothetical protein